MIALEWGKNTWGEEYVLIIPIRLEAKIHQTWWGFLWLLLTRRISANCGLGCCWNQSARLVRGMAAFSFLPFSPHQVLTTQHNYKSLEIQRANFHVYHFRLIRSGEALLWVPLLPGNNVAINTEDLYPIACTVDWFEQKIKNPACTRARLNPASLRCNVLLCVTLCGEPQVWLNTQQWFRTSPAARCSFN